VSRVDDQHRPGISGCAGKARRTLLSRGGKNGRTAHDQDSQNKKNYAAELACFYHGDHLFVILWRGSPCYSVISLRYYIRRRRVRQRPDRFSATESALVCQGVSMNFLQFDQIIF
jgi:hypothetical protein